MAHTPPYYYSTKVLDGSQIVHIRMVYSVTTYIIDKCGIHVVYIVRTVGEYNEHGNIQYGR